MSTVETSPKSVSTHSLHEHFGDLDQQREAATLGMWVFLATEIMFFGGMFTAYLVYRVAYPSAFNASSQDMNFWAGTINTAVLIVSSLTMALAVHASQEGKNKLVVALLLVTMLLGLAFLGIKGFEYHEHWVHHKVPGPSFEFEGVDPRHAQIFFSLYFAMTGFHALHMVIGLGLVSWIVILAMRNKFTPEYHSPVENVGLYWHFVDMVWIYLYPLLYLIAHKHVSG